jgi:alanine-synthesizing transaminase
VFSERARWNLTPNAVAVAVAARRASGRPFDDLTESNPTAAGLSLDFGSAFEALSSEAVRRYEPDPRGLLAPREAVRAYYGARGYDVGVDRIVLTASTSEAYGWIFKLLCDPGDDVLVAQPSYPLFDDLAKLEGVALRPFALSYEGRWELDLEALLTALTPRTRAVLLVHPNNPTGSLVSRESLNAVVDLCRTRGLALVVDEVFGDYTWREDPTRAGSAVDVRDALTFTLSGLSKVVAAPQIKLGWIVVGGPDTLRDEALSRLEMIADSYLSVSAPAQHAAGAFLSRREEIQRALMTRVRANLRAITARLHAESRATLLAADAGWYAVLRVPRTRREEEWTLELLDQDDVLVQPGWLFDFAREAYLVVSLLPREDVFARAIERLLARVDG